MRLFKFVLRTCRGMMVFTALTALLSGACNAGLIAMINAILGRTGTLAAALIWGFAGLVLGKVLTTYLSQYLLIRFSQEVIANLRQDLVHRILNVPLRQLEEIGTARVMVALTDDVLNISQAMLGLPVVAVNLALLAGGGAYLGWLSWKMLLVMSVFILVGGFSYRFFINRGMHHLNLAREVEDKLFAGFRGLTEGIKELKLHRDRRGVFLAESIQMPTQVYQRQNVVAESRFLLAQNWTHLLFFALIGLLLFLLPKLEPVSPKAMTGYIITTLYLMGPLAGVLAYFSLYGRGNISLQKVEQLGLSLAESPPDLSPALPGEARSEFKRLDLCEVTHAYQHEKDDSNFVLGPISLSLEASEVVFLVGGNGSGKSTLAKIIAGLYPPETGEIRLNGERITEANRDEYRQIFSAVFSDFYLFDSLLGLKSADLDAQAREFLAQLHLDHKVKVEGGRLSTIALSQGQRKRLALLTAYLEDRPFYLFDEWASDQDPLFKEVFYTQLLPELKARGKTILVITHDDKYFPLADRLCKLDYGRLVQDTRFVDGGGLATPHGVPGETAPAEAN